MVDDAEGEAADFFTPHDDASGDTTGDGAGLSGVKRKAESPKQGSAGKKRFVWPTALHHRFIAAVFDIGLRTSTPKDVCAVMAANDSFCTLSQDVCKGQLNKFREFRDPKRPGHQPFYEFDNHSLDSRVRSSASDLSHHLGDSIKHSSSQDDLQRSTLRALNAQIALVAQALSVQTAFADRLHLSLGRQAAIHSQMLADMGSEVPPPGGGMLGVGAPLQLMQPPPVSLLPYPVPPSRAELSMISEMREQMTLHRKLLLKREASRISDPADGVSPLGSANSDSDCGDIVAPGVSAGVGMGAASAIASAAATSGAAGGHGTAGGGTGVSNPWDEDALFFFLENEFAASPVHASASCQ